MLFLIIAILIFVIPCIMVTSTLKHFPNLDDLLIFLFIAVLSFLSIVFGFIVSPQHEDNYRTQKEISLVSLSNTCGISSHQSLCYVSINSENVYTYRYELENYNKVGNGDLETAYTVDTIKGWVTEVESSECSSPMLYVREYKNTWGVFRLGFGYTTEYVFYVPVGTISKDITLK